MGIICFNIQIRVLVLHCYCFLCYMLVCSSEVVITEFQFRFRTIHIYTLIVLGRLLISCIFFIGKLLSSKSVHWLPIAVLLSMLDCPGVHYFSPERLQIEHLFCFSSAWVYVDRVAVLMDLGIRTLLLLRAFSYWCLAFAACK